jgi:septum formation protein
MLEAGLDYTICPSPAEEIHDATMSPQELTEENARLKAVAVADRFPKQIVIGADTLVFIDGVPLGKPKDMAEAEAMIGRLVGRTHEVCTGVCLVRREPEAVKCFHVITKVTFRALDGAGIRDYLSKIEPLDKAGGYAAQEFGEQIIEGTEGSWSNVVGLPMERLLEELEVFGG